MTAAALPQALEDARVWLVQTLRAMGADLQVSALLEEEGPMLRIEDHPEAATLVGSRGQTLDAFQVLANTMFPMDDRIRVDCGDYRARQLARLNLESSRHAADESKTLAQRLRRGIMRPLMAFAAGSCMAITVTGFAWAVIQSGGQNSAQGPLRAVESLPAQVSGVHSGTEALSLNLSQGLAQN